MAGLALFGDLTPPSYAGNEVTSLTHRLESVKILPPRGFDPTEERLVRRHHEAGCRTAGNQTAESPPGCSV